MINTETKRKLRELNLDEINQILEQHDHNSDTLLLPFDERFQLIIDFIYQEKHNKRVQNLLTRAKLRITEADMTGIIYDQRGIERHVLQELGTCQFIQRCTNIIFQGFTGSGKTFLACAIGKEACKKGLRTRYIRIPDLLLERDAATLVQGAVSKLLTKYANFDILILDEWLLDDLSESDLHFLFELTERRYDSGSTIYCTQFRKQDWHQRLGGGVHADAMMDRIVHNAVWYDTGTLNMREKQAKIFN